MELINAIREFIQPALIILIPVLYFIGIALKNSARIPDNIIPLTLGGIGVVCAVACVLATSTIAGWQDALMALFTAFTQGILCAGCSVYVNQTLVKQPQKKLEDQSC